MRFLAGLVLVVVAAGALAVAASARRAATPVELVAILRALQLGDPDNPFGCTPLRATVSTVNPRYAAVKTIHLSRSCGDGAYLLVKRGSRWRIQTEASEWRCSVAPNGVVKDLFGACLP